MTQNYPLRKMLLTLSSLVNESGLSFKEIAKQAKTKLGVEVTPYQIRSVANSTFAEAKVVEKLDFYIDTTLRVIGSNDKKLISRFAQDTTDIQEHQDKRGFMAQYSADLRHFIADPRNLKWIEGAYKRSQADKLQQEATEIESK